MVSMSVSDRYWSFKLLLQGRQEQQETTSDPEFDVSSTARPFLFGATSATPPNGSAEHGSLISDYGKFDFTELDAVAVAVAAGVEVDSPSKPLPEPDKPKPAQVFIQPTQKELDKLSVADLRRLRREIALQIHPDLGEARSVQIDEDAMGRCNQMIDAAIKRKMTAKA